MTILTLPFVGISLLEHSAGGAILAKGGSYIAGTYVTPAVAQAFTTASTVLASVGGAVSAPVVGTGLAVAVVAAGGYCYFYGLPVPVEAALAKAGLGTAAKKGLIASTAAKGFAVPVPSLAIALVLLGGAGYVSYQFYQSRKEALAGADTIVILEGNGQKASEAAFGTTAWSRFGEALWTGIGDAAERAAKLASEAVTVVYEASGSAADIASDAAGSAFSAASKLRTESQSALRRLLARLGWRTNV